MLGASLVLGACGLEFSSLARWFVDLHLQENPDDPEPAAEDLTARQEIPTTVRA